MIGAVLTDDPRAHHHALATRLRMSRRGRARIEAPPAAEPIDASSPTMAPGTKWPVLALDPTRPAAEALETIELALALGPHAIMCGRCDRRLRGRGEGISAICPSDAQPIIAAEDWCRWCARPISERGEEVEREAFLALARRGMADRAPAAKAGPGPVSP